MLLIVALAFLVMASAVSMAGRSTKHDPSGSWQNLRGSTMHLDVVGENLYQTFIEGHYNNSEGPIKGSFLLYGSAVSLDAASLRLTFNVVWNNEKFETDSVTTWIGTYYPPDTIETTWLLLGASDTFANSTVTGRDQFHRVKSA